jgi:hypothetical protein
MPPPSSPAAASRPSLPIPSAAALPTSSNPPRPRASPSPAPPSTPADPGFPKLFPELLANRIRPTRQEVLYFGVPPGDDSFRPPAMPCWIDSAAGIYGLPDIETRGFKLAIDTHGPQVDPDTQSRLIPESTVAAARAYLLPPLPRARCRSLHPRRSLPVRKHRHRRLPHRSPPRPPQPLAPRRRLRPRLQTRPRHRRIRRRRPRRRRPC